MVGEEKRSTGWQQVVGITFQAPTLTVYMTFSVAHFINHGQSQGLHCLRGHLTSEACYVRGKLI